MKVVFAISTLLFCIHLHAQQKPHYTQYILNQYIINPALTGIENYTDIKVSHRRQWTGLDGAPVTSYFTVHAPIGKQDYRTTATSFAVPGENPRGNAYWQNYTAAEAHHGVGFQLVSDVAGAMSNLSAKVTYAYHLGLGARTNLSGGFGAGINRIALDASKLNFANASVDPVVYTSDRINRSNFDLVGGLYFYSADYFLGLSAQQIVPSKIDFSDNTLAVQNGTTVPHVFVSSGYRFLLSEDVNVIPSVMIKYIQPLPLQVETNVKFQFRDLLWAGGSYRHRDAVAGMVGVNLSNFINVGYSYDHPISAINHFSKGSHELLLGFILGNHYSDTCPRNVW